MKRCLLIAAVMAVALTSCRRERLDEELVQNSQGQGGSALTFSTYSQKTKGKVAYLDTLEAQGFAVWGFENDPDDNGNLTFFNVNKIPNFFSDDPDSCFQDVDYKESSGWGYTPVKYWPENNLATLDFIAMCPREITYGDEGRWVYTPGDTTSTIKAKAKWGNFRVNPNIGEQTDLLVATKFNVPEVPKVVLEFTHALSRLGFAAYTPDTNKTIKITKISLHDVKTTDVENPVGFFQDRGSIELWVENSSATGGATFPLNWNVATDGETKYNLSFQLGPDDMVDSGRVAKQIARLNNEDKYIMVIPAKNASDLEIYIEYDVYLKGSATPSHKSKKFACPVYEFEMGKAYLFNFNLSMNEVKFDCTVVPWDESAYSLNAGADVNASSDRDGFEVYVDAQRSSKLSGGKAVTVTTYSLYAEMGEDENDDYLLPVWKTYNKWGSDITGYELPIGELIDIYFNLYLSEKLDLGEYGEVTMEEVELDGKRYTKLSFTIEETTGSNSKKAFAGNYVAHYISEPIIASMAEGGVKDTATTKIIENGVKVNRSYSAWPLKQTISKDKQVPPPYETKVTLEITGTSQLGFEGWYKATGKYDSQGKDIWTKLDVTSPSSPYKEGTDHSLIFSEIILNVDGTDSSYVSLDGKYRAVFGEASGGNIAITFKKDTTKGQSIIPNAAKFAAGETVVLKTDAPEEGYQIKWYVKVPNQANDWLLDFGKSSTTTMDGVTYTRSTSAESKQQWVTFKAATVQDGYVFYTRYTTDVNVTLNGTSTTGVTMVANTHYKRADDADNNTVITFYPSAITNFQYPEVYSKTKDDWIPATVLTEQGVITFADDVLTVPGSQSSKIKTLLGTTDVKVRVNDHTYYTVDLGDYLSTYSKVLWEKSDGTSGAADAQQLKVDNNVAITLYHAVDDSTIFGFRTSKGESVHKDTCELKANYPGHTTTMYAVPGRPLRVVSNSSSEFGLQCDGCEIASFGPGVSKNVVVPLAFVNDKQIFDYIDIFTEDKSALVDVIASDGSTTKTIGVDETRPEWHPKVWFLTTVFIGSEYLSVKIQPKNGTQKLIEGGDLF